MFMAASSAMAYTLEHIGLDAIDIGGEIGRRIDVTVQNNLLVVDVDNDFLKPFQERNQEDGFIGLGMFIDAASRLAFHTGDPDMIARKEHVIAAAIATQEDDGYIGLMKPETRIAKLWDVHEMAYIVLGLTSDYALFGNDESLAAAKRLADYLVNNLTDNPPPGCFEGDLSPEMGVTGLGDALMYLSEQSSDGKYRDFCLDVLRIGIWRKPIVKGRFWPIDGHVYAYIDKCLLQLRLDPENKNTALHAMSDNVMQFLLEGEGLTTSGAVGDHECWHDTQAGLNNLGETCASVYMLKFYDELMRQSGDPLYGDLMERTIHNTLFGAQSPDGRQLRYYTPFEAQRVFFDKDTYCCPNNYRRGVSDLPKYVVYRTDAGLLVNLYTPCTVETTLKDGTKVALVQETAYPSDGAVTVRVAPEAEKVFALGFRIPRWCANPSIRVNGETVDADCAQASICTIERSWKKGDVVELSLPMELRLVKGRRSLVGRVAVMYGPLIFGLSKERNEGLEDIQARLLTMNVDTLEGPIPDDSVHPGGLACTVEVWDPGRWYPGPASRTLTLTEFPDPGIEAAFFVVPNPEDERFVTDDLFAAVR
jgi:DUF1680 family protein